MVATRDVARIYHIDVRIINQTVKRNIKRFPEDFYFQLTKKEYNSKRGGNRFLPYAFTEHGIIMLSGLLKSDITVKVNVKVIKAFISIKKYISNNLIEQQFINNLVLEHDKDIKLLQETFNKLEEKEYINIILSKID